MILLLQIFPLDMTVADRWFYFPIIGLLGIIGVLSEMIAKKITGHKSFFTALIMVALIILGIRTMARNANWYSEEVLCGHDLVFESNFDTEGAYGVVLASEGKLKDAYLHQKKSVDMDPYDVNLSNLGVISWRLGNVKEAERYFFKSLGAKTYDEVGYRHNTAIYQNIVEFYIKYDLRILT